MARERHQRGRVVESGKRKKAWRGHYYIYTTSPDGTEVRRHKNVLLGPKSELRKWEAENKLKEIIARDARVLEAKPDDTVTLSWFWKHRFLPLKSAWRVSTRVVIEAVVRKHVLSKFGDLPLKDIKRFDLQAHLNSLAKQYSKSLVRKVRTWIKAILDEALEQEYLEKNPARKLACPVTRGTCKRFLTVEEYHRLLGVLHPRNQLILRLFVLGAFRPGELFALRWKCFEDDTLKVDASVFRGELGATKTISSAAPVTLPVSLTADLERWREHCGYPDLETLIFPSQVNKPINAQNLLQRVLQPAAEKVGIEGLTFQCLRRTFATHFHGVGTLKDQQSQMRHSTAQITLDVYTQSVSASLRTAMEAFDRKLQATKSTAADQVDQKPAGPRSPKSLSNPIEPKSGKRKTASD